jgi:hypothetical protein
MKVIKAKPSARRPLTEEMIDVAIEQGQARRTNSLQAVSVTFEKPSLIIRFEDGSGVNSVCRPVFKTCPRISMAST